MIHGPRQVTCVFLLLLLALASASCGGRTALPVVSAPPVPPPVEIAPPPAPQTVGSLWTSASTAGLVSDLKAHRPGDVLTVKIVEASNGAQAATTELGKENDYSLGMPVLFGLEQEMKGRVTPGFDPAKLFEVETSKSFKGDGTTVRSNSLVATLSVRVMSVGQDGRMAISGIKEVKVNRERQVLTLSGVVRAEDVGPDNTIPSTSIADLRIHYGGVGELNDNMRQGWFSRLLEKLWPF
jgi:flagellar L-ring protein precursor FlgH